MNLLLVDDDKLDRLNTKRQLKKANIDINIVETSSAEEGLELATQKSWDLILLDYQLPTMTGLELLRSIRQSSEKSTAIVMLSHSDDERIAFDCIVSGAQDFIVKGEITPSRLVRSLLHAKEREKNEVELRRLAETDSLTGLANRRFFEMSLQHHMSQAARLNKHLGLMVLDLDKFKHVNDSLGHHCGDELLREVARRLQGPVRQGDIICRLGGDEFSILVCNLDDPILMTKLSDRILEAFAAPTDVGDGEVNISSSIGIATYPDCAKTPESLMKCADMAMYQAKENGSNQVRFYSETLNQEIIRRSELEKDLYGVISRQELEVHYQAQVSTGTKEIAAVEALLRWHHPDKGWISPAEFIPIAEDSGLIRSIGRWVIDQSCQQMQAWRESFPAAKDITIAVNLSPLQLDDDEFYADLLGYLKKYNLPADKLELELTENNIVKSKAAGNILRNIAQRGMRLALDDFGTGYASLSQLKKYPFQVLKIDQSFIQSIHNDDDEDLRFLTAINEFAKSLQIEMVIEGVETEQQMLWCEQLAFNRVQGFFLHRPMPAVDLEAVYFN